MRTEPGEHAVFLAIAARRAQVKKLAGLDNDNLRPHHSAARAKIALGCYRHLGDLEVTIDCGQTWIPRAVFGGVK
jgi:hypothetical protein